MPISRWSAQSQWNLEIIFHGTAISKFEQKFIYPLCETLISF